MTQRPHDTITYAFIDSQNLNLGTSKDIYRKGKKIYSSWKLDFRRFRRYLKDKFRVSKAILFLDYLKRNKRQYQTVKSFGYEIVFGPTVKDDKGYPKGNHRPWQGRPTAARMGQPSITYIRPRKIGSDQTNRCLRKGS